MYQIRKLPKTTFDFLINVIYQIRKFIRSGFITTDFEAYNRTEFSNP